MSSTTIVIHDQQSPTLTVNKDGVFVLPSRSQKSSMTLPPLPPGTTAFIAPGEQSRNSRVLDKPSQSTLKMKGTTTDGGGTTGGEVVQNLDESSDMSADSLNRDNEGEEEEKLPLQPLPRLSEHPSVVNFEHDPEKDQIYSPGAMSRSDTDEVQSIVVAVQSRGSLGCRGAIVD